MQIKDSKDEAEKSMDKFITGTVTITKDNMKFVYKKMIALNELNTQSGRKYMIEEELWEFIQKNTKKTDTGVIKDQYQLKKAILELEDKGKIMIGEDNEFIYLY